MQMTGVILVGGKSRRINTKKTLLRWEDGSIIRAEISRIKDLFDEFFIISKDVSLADLGVNPVRNLRMEETERKMMEISNGVKIYTDIVKNKGPLGGIYTGLLRAKNFYSFFFACDMPFLNPKLIKYMQRINPVPSKRGGVKGGFDIIIPQTFDGLHPLHSIYSKNCISKIKSQFKKNSLRIVDIFEGLRVKYLKSEIEKFNPDLSLFNINTMEDYKKALKIARDLKE